MKKIFKIIFAIACLYIGIYIYYWSKNDYKNLSIYTSDYIKADTLDLLILINGKKADSVSISGLFNEHKYSIPLGRNMITFIEKSKNDTTVLYFYTLPMSWLILEYFPVYNNKQDEKDYAIVYDIFSHPILLH